MFASTTLGSSTMHSACRSSWLNRPTTLRGTTAHSARHHASRHNGARRVPPLSPGSFRRASGPTPIATVKTNAHKMTGAIRNSGMPLLRRPIPRCSTSPLPHSAENRRRLPNGSLPIHRVGNVTLSASRTADAYEPSSGRTSCAQPYGSRA